MTTRRSFLSTLAAAGAASLAPAAPARRPNFIFLLIDDLGWSDFGCYGNPYFETPAIDALAKRGVRFTDAYAACPVCSPTRASILTGKYPARLKVTDWIPGRKQWPSAKLLVPQFNQQLPLPETTIAEALKPLGYRSASIGKWHLGGDGFKPENQGFDVSIGGDHRGGIRSFFGPFDLPGLTNTTADDYITEKLTEAALDFIGKASSDRQPFFLYLPEYTVHIPLAAREAMAGKYRRKPGADVKFNPVYAAMVETVDHVVAALFKKLEECGIADNTVFFLTSDNGGLLYEGGSKRAVTDNSPLRAGKGHLYEGGIREPLLIHWPGVTKPGAETGVPVSSVDFFPTILEMAGGRVEKGAVDGVSLAPLLRGGPAPKRDALYWHYPHYSNQGGAPGGAIREGDYKLIEFYEDNRLELFRLRNDVGERVNLVNAMPDKAKAMRAKLDRWRKSVDAAMPRPNPNYDAAQADQGLTGVEPPTPPK